MNDLIAFVGGGNMTTALIAGLTQKYPSARIVVADRNAGKRDNLQARFGVVAMPAQADLPDADVLVLAVKPADMRPVCKQARGKIIVSIAAGLRLARMAQWFATPPSVIARAMPNTPAAVALGLTVCHAAPTVSHEDQQKITALFAAAGDVVWADKEAMLDVAAAVSGGGPAYAYYLMEAMQEAAENMGMTPDLARRATAQTLYGAGKMACLGQDFAALRHAVTSKRGTTERAITVMEQRQMKAIVNDAMQAAFSRAKEIADKLDADE